MNNLSIKTFNYLLDTGVVPNTGNYAITNSMLEAFVHTYSLLGSGGKKHSINFAKKLAGLSCLKHKLSLGYSYKEIKEGIVYLISNPAWPDSLKVGMTIDLDKRLKQYQTYSPLRDYKVEHYRFVFNRKLAESRILTSSLVDPQEGEWVKYTDALHLIRKYTE